MSGYYPFYDSFNVGEFGNMEVTPGTPEKQKAALLTEGYFEQPPIPWEQRIDNGYPNVFYDEEEKIYRLYYTCILFDEESTREAPENRVHKTYKIGRSQGIKPRIAGMLYACSKDGTHWIRPELNIVESQGSKKNNIIMYDVHGGSVFKDGHEKDPQRRFKMMIRNDAKEEMAVAFSADGIHFSDPIPWPKYNPAGDTHNFAFYDERIKRYVLITRTWDGLRIVARCESDDFINWEQPENIYRGVGLDDQIYSMPVFRHYDNYIGLASIFRGGDREAEDFDCVDLELTYSHDGKCFDRIAMGKPFIPRGLGKYGSGVKDACCIYASVPVEIENKLVFYYLGGTGQHTNFRESTLMKCEIDKEKLAGYEPKNRKGGWITTRALQFTGEDIYINCDILPGGYIEYAIKEAPKGFYAKPQPIEGYDFENTATIEESGRNSLFFQGGKPQDLDKEKNYVLVFKVVNSVIYGFGGEANPKFKPR